MGLGFERLSGQGANHFRLVHSEIGQMGCAGGLNTGADVGVRNSAAANAIQPVFEVGSGAVAGALHDDVRLGQNSVVAIVIGLAIDPETVARQFHDAVRAAKDDAAILERAHHGAVVSGGVVLRELDGRVDGIGALQVVQGVRRTGGV